ncbi:hypothetical protein FRC06_005198, partial [Ceratobasidium sp. 370]
MYGVSYCTTIINSPQSCILAVGATQPVIVPAPEEEKGWRTAQIMKVTLRSYHRTVDGAVAARWLQAFRGYLENPEDAAEWKEEWRHERQVATEQCDPSSLKGFTAAKSRAGEFRLDDRVSLYLETIIRLIIGYLVPACCIDSCILLGCKLTFDPPPTMDQSTLGAILATGAALAVIYSWNKSRHSVPLPPGPKGHPIFGSALEISTADASWLKFAEYADQYGPVISVRILHQRMYILSDYHIVSELVEKRAANYSNKGANGMAKLIGWDKDILFMAYGPTFKRYRTMLSRALNNRVSLDYVPVQQHEVQRFLKRLLDQPSEFMEHVHLLAASIAVRIAYGHRVESHDDRFVKVAEEHMAGMSE